MVRTKCQVHVVLYLVEGHFGLYHPELGQVAGSVGVLGPECRSECVDLAQGHRSELTLELTADGQVGVAAEEVLRPVHLSFRSAGRIAHVEGSHLEHSACTLSVRCCDEGCVKVVETLVVEVFVNGVCHGVADSQHGSEGVGAWTQMCDLAQELHAVTFFLERVFLGVCGAVDLDGGCLDLHLLTAADGFDEFSCYCDACSRSDVLEGLIGGESRHVAYNLYVVDGRTVVEGDECDVLVASFGPYPALGEYFLAGGLFEKLCDFLSLECHYMCFLYFHI